MTYIVWTNYGWHEFGEHRFTSLEECRAWCATRPNDPHIITILVEEISASEVPHA